MRALLGGWNAWVAAGGATEPIDAPEATPVETKKPAEASPTTTTATKHKTKTTSKRTPKRASKGD
ncbi:MAG TPA: hypothetical protein VJT82_04435 [Pyrinomonadaceae bacterium]|nr:hypothetical protein [Pyrinomonadaceae bacterium]